MSRVPSMASINKEELINFNNNIIELLGLPKEDFSRDMTNEYLREIAKPRYRLLKAKFPKLSVGMLRYDVNNDVVHFALHGRYPE